MNILLGFWRQPFWNFVTNSIILKNNQNGQKPN